MNKTTLYQKARTGKVQQWSIWVEKKGTSDHPEVWIEHGQVDGKKQTTRDVIKEGVNIGKANETTPLQQAELTVDRKIKKQREKGYVDSIEELSKSRTIDFTIPFPKELCFYKPNKPDADAIHTLENSDRAVYTVKRDGMMHIIRKTKEFGVEIYSRRIDLVTDKYPHLVTELEKIKDYDFIMLGEIILDNDGKDNFNGVSQICRSDAEKAIAKQKELGQVKYYIFDLAFMTDKGGEPWENMLTTHSYIERLNALHDNILCQLNENSPIMCCEILNYNNNDLDTWWPGHRTTMTHKEALKNVQDRKLEGLVVWDADGKMNVDEAFTFNGKPYRPKVLWKSKPKYEDDFIVRWDPANGIGDYGSGKNHGKIKNAFLYQLDENGQEIFIAKCGGGLSDEQRDFYTAAKYPRVWRVEYDSVQPKTGSLRYPVFNADRTLSGDKDVDECQLGEDIKKAREQ